MSGPNYVSVNGNCYYIKETKLSIDDAKKYCQTAFGSKFGGRLYEPKDKATHDLVITAANKLVQDWLWLGISDMLSSKGTFQYSSTGSLLLFTNWRAGQYFYLADFSCFSGQNSGRIVSNF